MSGNTGKSFRISGGAPGDRLRFSVAHEFGHLVLHQALVITQAAKGNLNEIEDQADRFASEFLMPEVAMHREITATVTLSSLVDLKKRWNVSIQALIHRACDLGIVTERRYRYLFGLIGHQIAFARLLHDLQAQ